MLVSPTLWYWGVVVYKIKLEKGDLKSHLRPKDIGELEVRLVLQKAQSDLHVYGLHS